MYSLSNEEKEVKDMSKNLVSGDFEREYRDGILEKPHRRHNFVNTVLVVVVCVLACWLVGLTAVREVQLSRLRHEVGELSADVLAMKMTINALNQKLQNKLNTDTIYEDIDEGNIPVDDEKVMVAGHDESNDSLEKLRDITVLETVEDDEDMYDDEDDDDEESGDWYTDYDRRREKIGKSNMVRLKPEDFTESVVKLRADASPLWELKEMLNKDPQNPDVFAAAKSDMMLEENDREKRSITVEPSTDFVDQFAAPRSISKTEERRKNKKYKSPAKVEAPQPQPLKMLNPKYPNRITRQSDDTEGARRPFIAAHFHGNTSHLNIESHEHYKGNGLLRVPHDSPHDVWYPSPWTISSPHPRPTLTRSGHVRVHHTGVYFVYVQIYYLDSHDTISWVLHRTNADTEGRDKLLQCAQYSSQQDHIERPNSCFSAAALLLRAGDRLVVRNTEGDRHSLMQPEKSFIGLVKLADAEDPEEEQF